MRTVKIENGKYEFDLDDAGIMIAARRNGEPWSAGMEFRFAKCFMSMLWELEESRAAHNAGAQEPVELHFGHGELVVQAIKVSDFEFPGIAVYRAAQPGEVGASAKREPSVEDPAVLAKSVLLVFPTTEQRNRVEDALVNAQPQPTTDAARDADRLDWIERNHTLHKAVEFLYVVDGYQVQHTHDCCEVGDAFHGETLRDAIDAAMKAEIERIEREGEA